MPASPPPIPQPASPRPDGSGAHGVVEGTIQRLEDVLDQETAALRNRVAIDLKDFNNRKSQGLLDLTRALRVLDGVAKDQALLARLAGLRAKLDANKAVLAMHLAAVREVAAVMTDAIRDADSDGTYSRSIRSGGYGYD